MFWDLALSDIARQAPILSQTCLNSPHTSQQVRIFCRPTKNRLVCGGLKVIIVSLLYVWRLQISHTPRKLHESIWNRCQKTHKLLARFYTQFQKQKKKIKLLLAKTMGDKSRNILVTKTAINFNWPYRWIRSAKLTNHSLCTTIAI